jgi:hypothetical protein
LLHNRHHYKHTTYECGHEFYEDNEGNYLARWELPDKFTTTKIVDLGNCGCKMNAPSNPLTTYVETSTLSKCFTNLLT